jgi:hypothetical protein
MASRVLAVQQIQDVIPEDPWREEATRTTVLCRDNELINGTAIFGSGVLLAEKVRVARLVS